MSEPGDSRWDTQKAGLFGTTWAPLDFFPWLFIFVILAFRLTTGFAASGLEPEADTWTPLLINASVVPVIAMALALMRWWVQKVPSLALARVLAVVFYPASGVIVPYWVVWLRPSSRFADNVQEIIIALQFLLTVQSVLAAVLSIFVVKRLSNQWAELASLKTMSAELSYRSEQTQKSIADFQREIGAQTNATIRPLAEKLLGQITRMTGAASAREALASDLEVALSRVVQPFIKSLRARRLSSPLGPARGDQRPPTQRALSLRMSLSQSLLPGFGLLIVPALALPALALSNAVTPSGAVVGAGLVLLMSAIGELLKYAVANRDKSASQGNPAGAIAIIMVLNAAVYAGHLSLLRYLLAPLYESLFAVESGGLRAGQVFITELLSGSVFPWATMVGVSLLVSLFEISRGVLAAALGQQEVVRVGLAREKALLTGSLWHIRHQTTNFVHGAVQSALVSTALRLKSPQKAGLQKAQQVIANLLDELEAQGKSFTNLPTLEEFLAKLSLTWDGLASIEVTFADPQGSPDELEAISLSLLKEILREGVGNAVKHGRATLIDISIGGLGKGLVSIVISDNGAEAPESERRGFGTELFNEVALNWSRTRESNRTLLRLSLPQPERSRTRT